MTSTDAIAVVALMAIVAGDDENYNYEYNYW